MSYTKGPWELWTSCSYKRFCTHDGAGVVTPYVNPADGHPDLLVSDDDAKLICAAPDLYEALKALVSIVDKMPADLNKYPTLFGILVEAHEILKKAEL